MQGMNCFNSVICWDYVPASAAENGNHLALSEFHLICLSYEQASLQI